MTQEEFYIWLLNCDSGTPKFTEFNPEFLKNYEITKLFLDKFGMNNLNKEDQKNLNLEAISIWFTHPSYITLKYDIPEILELLPEKLKGFLNLLNSKIETLPKLESVGGGLSLSYSRIQSLPQLESVGGYLDLRDSKIKSLPKLESVGWVLYLQNSKIQSLPKLESVGKFIIIEKNNLNYWKNYFNETGRPHLADKVKG